MATTSKQPAQTLASRFESSLSAFRTRDGCNNPAQPLELTITNIASNACAARRFGPEVNELLQLGARQMAKQTVGGMIRSIIEGIGQCCDRGVRRNGVSRRVPGASPSGSAAGQVLAD